jgi:hypothetical protein
LSLSFTRGGRRTTWCPRSMNGVEDTTCVGTLIISHHLRLENHNIPFRTPDARNPRKQGGTPRPRGVCFSKLVASRARPCARAFMASAPSQDAPNPQLENSPLPRGCLAADEWERERRAWYTHEASAIRSYVQTRRRFTTLSMRR